MNRLVFNDVPEPRALGSAERCHKRAEADGKAKASVLVSCAAGPPSSFP